MNFFRTLRSAFESTLSRRDEFRISAGLERKNENIIDEYRTEEDATSAHSLEDDRESLG